MPEVRFAAVTCQELVDVSNCVIQQIVNRHPLFPVPIAVLFCSLGTGSGDLSKTDWRHKVVAELFYGVAAHRARSEL